MYSAIDNIHFHFLYIDRYSFGRNWIFPESSIPYNMLRYIESGTASFFIDSQEYSVKKDQIIYIPKGSQLSCFATSSHFSFTSIPGVWQLNSSKISSGLEKPVFFCQILWK